MTAESSSRDVTLQAEQPEISKHLLMAAASSAFAELLTFPIDTVKVYLQLQKHSTRLPEQLEVGSAHSGMKSGHSHHNHRLGLSNLLFTTNDIYKKHGLRGFYR